ncbi:MAG: hypothetical protein E7317_08595 [Clostridiales bacterium]|nr:hypothetical protein [Clostridiales bacterium]
MNKLITAIVAVSLFVLGSITALADSIKEMQFYLRDSFYLVEENSNDDMIVFQYANDEVDMAAMFMYIDSYGLSLQAFTELYINEVFGVKVENYNTLTYGNNTFSFYRFKDEVEWLISIFEHNDAFYCVVFNYADVSDMSLWTDTIMNIEWLDVEQPIEQTADSEPVVVESADISYEIKDKSFGYTRNIGKDVYKADVYRIVTPSGKLNEEELRKIFWEACVSDPEYQLHAAFFYPDWKYATYEGETYLDSDAYARLFQEALGAEPEYERFS